MKYICLLVLLFTACEQTPVEPDKPTLASAQWVLTAVERNGDATEVLQRTDYRIGFALKDRIWATLACNTEIYSPAAMTDSTVHVPDLVGFGGIQCLNDPYSVMIRDQFRLGPLPYRIDGDTLRLVGEELTLRFAAILTGIPWIGPELDISCQGPDSTDICLFDHDVDSSNLSPTDLAWLDARASDPYTKEIALVELRDSTFRDSLLILNLTSGIRVAVHIREIRTGTFDKRRWSGVVEGSSGIGTASFAVYSEGTTFGDFRFGKEIFHLQSFQPGMYLLTRIDTSVPPMPD